MHSQRPETMSATRLINEHQAAEVLGLSVKTLRRWRWQRRGPTWFKVGEAVRYEMGDLRAYIESGRHEVVHV